MGGGLSREDYLAGKHVLITGGSEGIGLALGKECYKRSAKVALMARTASKLDAAVAELQAIQAKRAGSVRSCPADVTQADQVAQAIASLQQQTGSIDVVICCAGRAEPGLFLEQDTSVATRTMQLNYFGTHNVIKAVLPQMVQHNSGHVVLISSGVALAGILGYSSYAPSKMAVRGLADILRHELCWTNVKISIGYPPDTDTPGFEAEQKIKPPGCEECTRAMGSSVSSAQQVASHIVQSMEKGHYHLASPDFGQNLLMGSLAGISPPPYLLLTSLLGHKPTISALPSSQEILVREAHKAAWPEVNLDALEVTKVGRRVRQHVNPFKEELQVPIQPPNWGQIFHRPTLPLTVDIGCGLRLRIDMMQALEGSFLQ
ncbi:hypothetical protein WJX84_002656, partial [Apatococcus fuscideae]